MNKIKKGDEVVVLTGKDKGKRSVVLKVIEERDRIVVENVNMVKRHTKGNPMQGAAGGIVEKEMSIHISNIAIWNPVSNKGDRIGFKSLEDGRKVRVFRSTNEVVDI
ncbi:MAG: 50S ribosomal protein L24 [Gammaproteobacteria bacterium]|nr:50S ribosomal protein L24 [Gammaproteobacteria bacterium]